MTEGPTHFCYTCNHLSHPGRYINGEYWLGDLGCRKANRIILANTTLDECETPAWCPFLKEKA